MTWKDEMAAVARRIRNVNILDGERVFLRESDLVKICRSGRKVTYRFFLFSDMLLYGHLPFSSDQWKVHEQLLLSMLRISEDEAASGKSLDDCSFSILHPKKSFVVTAPSPSIKKEWVRDISRAAEEVLLTANRKSYSLKDGHLSPLVELESERSMANVAGSDASLMAGNGTPVSAELREHFFRGLEYFNAGHLKPTAEKDGSTGSVPLILFGLFKQSTEGDCATPLAESSDPKLLAWQANCGMSTAEAMDSFLNILSTAAPDWDDDQTHFFSPDSISESARSRGDSG
jgi:hypothetical protein